MDRFACDWHRLATTDPKDTTAPIIVRISENSKKNFSSGSILPGKTAWAGYYSLSHRQMIDLYGGGNVSTCGFSSGGALALGVAAHNNAQPAPLPPPRHIVAVSPGEVPWNDAEKARMQALNEKDVAIDYAFMVLVEKFMRHGRKDVPDYMISGSRGDFSGVGDIHFFYSADEVLYGALPDFQAACKRANVPCSAFARPGMVHCYCMLPYFKEAREDFAKITEILKK